MTREPLPPHELGPHLADVLSVLGPLYRKCQRLVEDNQDVEGISIGVRAILDMLRIHDTMTVPQMARQQALSRQFVQRMTNEALTHHWIELKPNPHHKRSPLVTLTPAGRQLIEAVAHREQTRLGNIDGDLTTEDVDACKRVLSHLLTELRDVDV